MLAHRDILLRNGSPSENSSLASDVHGLLAAHINNGGFTFPLSTAVVLTLLMCAMSLTTVLGNILVIVAFAVDGSLRNHSCYFLLNLAICDFLVGSVSVPWNIPYTLTGKWTHGRAACKLWLVIDSAVCISSVYTILLVTYDRFLSVTKAVSYSVQQRASKTTSKVFIQMGATWVVAFLVSAPAIIFWDIVVGHSSLPEATCSFEFNNSWYFLIGLSLLDFYVPFISIVYFNLSIYSNIRKRNKKRLKSLKLQKKPEKKIFFTQDNSPSSPSTGLNIQMKVGSLSLYSTKTPNQIVHAGNETLAINSVIKVNTAQPISPETLAKVITTHTNSKLNKDIKIAKSLTIIVINVLKHF
ncbi:histamine H3 receptor-like [Ambystoma mexicanum]|uniref:histamine H3 receptor-like n=1 Tax=Ambystoma mexicanum TaxID=8296 RepID=UPI0037E726E9